MTSAAQPGGSSAVHQLIVEFVGDRRVLSPGDELTFGRAADLVLDHNPNLHRVLGRFSWASDLWWLTNVGSAIPVTLADEHGASSLKVAPGASVSITFDEARLTFDAGVAAYELRLQQLGGPSIQPVADSRTAPDAEATNMPASLPLTDEQRLLLVALAEHELRDLPSGRGMGTNRQIAARLGWTVTKFNRKLDRLCRRFAGAGVAGLVGDSSTLARDRRLRLVEHALHAGVISRADLPLLDRATSHQ